MFLFYSMRMTRVPVRAAPDGCENRPQLSSQFVVPNRWRLAAMDMLLGK